VNADVTGDFVALQRLRVRLRTVGDSTTRRAIMGELKDDSVGLVRKGYAEQRSPYGVKWQPAKYQTGSSLLVASGKLLGSIGGKATTDSFTLRAKQRYGWYHQHGAQVRGRKRRVTVAGPIRRVTVSGPLPKGKRKRKTIQVGRRKRITVNDRLGFLPARPFLPVQWEFPALWTPVYQDATFRIIRRHFGK
jgi:phage gpG-like protein